MLQQVIQRLGVDVGATDHDGDLLAFEATGLFHERPQRHTGCAFDDLVVLVSHPADRIGDFLFADQDVIIDQLAAQVEGDGAGFTAAG